MVRIGSLISFISLCASAGVIFETFSGSDERGRFSKGDTRAEFGLCFLLDVSFQQVYIDQIDLVQWKLCRTFKNKAEMQADGGPWGQTC